MFHVKHEPDSPPSLQEALAAAGLEVGPAAIDRCLAYWDLLLDSADQLNLISRNSLAAGPLRHVGDSLMALAGWDLSGGLSLLDVGSGGGLPGIPLALAIPDLSVTLLEPKERKADWLGLAVGRLDLSSRVTVRQTRFEEFGREAAGRFEVVTARALAPPERAFRMILPALGRDARLLIWHSSQQAEEIKASLEKNLGEGRHTSSYTVKYIFDSINFSSNITGVREAR